MKVLVCGGRDWRDGGFVWLRLDRLHARKGIDLIVQGGADGVDTHARLWAKLQGVLCVTYEADWKTHGKAAGPIRNAEMLKAEQPDLVVAFPGGRGTADMVRQARAAGVEVLELKP